MVRPRQVTSITSFIIAAAVSLSNVFVTTPLLSDDPVVEKSTKTSDSGFSTAWQLIQSVTDKVAAEHISPPTRQQMYLAACRGIFIANHERPPSDLSATFSKLTTEEQFRSQVAEFWNDSDNDALPPEALVKVCVAAMLFDCEPGCTFISENDNRINQQLAENQYVGIGIKVDRKDGYPRIVEPYFGGAAQQAGARKGDLIITVDGVATKDRDFRAIIEQLRGDKGTSLTVELRHENEDAVRQYTMVRNVIPIDSVTGNERNKDDGRWDLALPGHPEIAYLKFNSIVGSTAAEVSQFAQRIESGNFRGVILDFTNSQRELATDIHHAVMLADVLLGEARIGEIVTSKNKTEIRTQPDHVFKNMALVILAPARVSGPEFFILSALANHDRAKIVGPQILSDGHCRKSIELGNMGAIERLSYAKVIPQKPQPNQTLVNDHRNNDPFAASQRLVLEPDVKMDVDDQIDQYVKAAVEILNQPK